MWRRHPGDNAVNACVGWFPVRLDLQKQVWGWIWQANCCLLTHDLAPNFLNCGSWFPVRVVKTLAAAYGFYTCDDHKLTQNQTHNESKLFLEVLICVEQCFTVALLLNKQYVLLNTQVMPKNLAFKHRHTNRLLYARNCSVFNVYLKYSALIGIWRLNFGKERLLIFLYLYAPNI